jgi:hypothetical protein
MQRCPQEVLDCIIDHCHNDNQTLSACTLTYRRWQSACHHHLFTFARLRTIRRCKDFSDILHTNPGIGSHIRHLAILVDGEDVNSLIMWMKDNFAPMAECLLQVATLTLRSLNFQEVGPCKEFWLGLANLRSIREVYVYMCEFDDIWQARRLLHCFPSLEEFDFWWNQWLPQEYPVSLVEPFFYGPSTPVPCPFWKLRVVSLGDCPITELAAMLLHDGSSKTIELLSFNLSDMDLVKASEALMYSAAKSLEQICIDCVTFPVTPCIGLSTYLH